ncbi:MAG: phospholipase D-like domain-containing protein, partial [Candidatus Thorarchaeota archaeon]
AVPNQSELNSYQGRNMKSKYLSFIFVILFVFSAVPNTVNPNIVSLDVAATFQTADTLPFQTLNRDMNVTTFVSADGSKEELWHFLSSAQESIYVEIYGINNPYILDYIHELNNSNPSLDWKFLIGEGSLGYFTPNDYVAYNLSQHGFEVKWTSDVDFVYAHQKFVIIDNKTTIVQAGNWAKTSFPEEGKIANREWNIAMTDTAITDVYRSVFDDDWKNGTYYDISDGTGSPLSYSQTGSAYPRPFNVSGQFSGPMNVTPIFSPDTSLEGILYCINAATVTLDIQIPYFANIGDGGSVDQIVDAILAAKARGVTVRIITEDKYDFDELVAIMIPAGIPVVDQYKSWILLHNKGIIVDGRMVLVSSINYSDNSIENNREAGVIIEHEGVAQWYLEVYDYDWGMGDFHEIEDVNLYWSPNIPTSTDIINVTVYGHELNDSVNLDEVRLRVKIGAGAWNNHTITDNIFESSESDLENYFYEISPQPDGTNITVSAHINNGTHWFDGMEMVIRVLDEVITQIDDPPTIDSPANIEYELGDTGNAIVWHPSDTDPQNYTLTQNSILFAQDDWSGGDITIDIDGLGTGTYLYELTVYDQTGKSASDLVQVTVIDTTDPSINSPADIAYVSGSTGNSITWTVSDFEPDHYTITRNGTEVADEIWDGSSIIFDIDGLGVGTHIFEIIVYDETGNSASDTVVVTVTPTDSQILIYLAIGVVGVIVVLIFGASKRR